ncbi:hypothetical protein RvY_01391-2 [Ramazzottius varieornatus]|uniref:BRCT domain-containing protein n=1 Tax=Ramazzottius varieornatus TaxID=947166 RepID=A0A1D1UG57_RAMVA|nr:hypothetical protein RvY_01391-2 [Ramazzottius varieornatus]
MGGLTSAALTATCTHLVTPVVGSGKYHAAKENGIKVVLPGWVDEIYRLGMMTDQDYSDDAKLATKFATPIFAGVSVSVSQASQPQRLEIKTLMMEYGGEYGDDFTRAIANPTGNKYAAAGVWMVPIVRSQWMVLSRLRKVSTGRTEGPWDTSEK